MLLSPGFTTALTAEGDWDWGPGWLEDLMEQLPEPTERSRGCQGWAGMPGKVKQGAV